jgi:hypothetical protein
MTPSPTMRRRHVLVAALLLAATPAVAAAAERAAQPNLTARVAVGHAVTVTPWSGARISGVVTEVTDCYMVLHTRDGLHALPLPEIKTLRRHDRRTQNAGTTAIVEASAQCDRIDCLPAAFLLLGVAGVVEGISQLAQPSTVVYRAKRRDAAVAACTIPPANEPSLDPMVLWTVGLE